MGVMTSDWQVLGLKCADKWLLPEDIQGQEAGRHHQAAHHCSPPSASPTPTYRVTATVNSQQTLLFRLCSHCDGGSTSLMFGGGGAEYGEEEEEDYQYHNWGVDRVDLDFKSGQHRLQTTNKRNLFLTPTFSKWRFGEDWGPSSKNFHYFQSQICSLC